MEAAGIAEVAATAGSDGGGLVGAEGVRSSSGLWAKKHRRREQSWPCLQNWVRKREGCSLDAGGRE